MIVISEKDKAMLANLGTPFLKGNTKQVYHRLLSINRKLRGLMAAQTLIINCSWQAEDTGWTARVLEHQARALTKDINELTSEHSHYPLKLRHAAWDVDYNPGDMYENKLWLKAQKEKARAKLDDFSLDDIPF